MKFDAHGSLEMEIECKICRSSAKPVSVLSSLHCIKFECGDSRRFRESMEVAVGCPATDDFSCWFPGCGQQFTTIADLHSHLPQCGIKRFHCPRVNSGKVKCNKLIDPDNCDGHLLLDCNTFKCIHCEFLWDVTKAQRAEHSSEVASLKEKAYELKDFLLHIVEVDYHQVASSGSYERHLQLFRTIRRTVAAAYKLYQSDVSTEDFQNRTEDAVEVLNGRSAELQLYEHCVQQALSEIHTRIDETETSGMLCPIFLGRIRDMATSFLETTKQCDSRDWKDSALIALQFNRQCSSLPAKPNVKESNPNERQQAERLIQETRQITQQILVATVID